MDYILFTIFLAFILYSCQMLGIEGSIKKTHKCTDCVEFRGTHHKKQVLTESFDRPYELSYYDHSHKLFFSYNIEDGEKEEDTFKIAYLDVKSIAHKEVDVENGFATAVDHVNRSVYFGGSEGIYRYHPDETNAKEKEIVTKVNVWDMFYGHGQLYYITYPKQRLYKVEVHKNHTKSERVKTVHERIYQFAIDGKNDSYFTNDTGLYRIKNGTEDRTRCHGESVFRAMAVDRKGEIYFAGKHGIFVMEEHKGNHTLHEIAHVRNLFGLTFDPDNNLIYSDYRKIVKIIPDTSTTTNKSPKKH